MKVSIDRIVLTYGTDYSVSNKQVELLTAPTVDTAVTVYRETSTGRLVGWEDASIMTASDLTLEQVQQLHLAEETMDKVQDSGLALDPLDSQWDARFTVLKNLLDPVNPGDAVPLRYLNGIQGAVVIAKDTAVIAASAASVSAAAALLSEQKAKTSETNAKTSEDNAKVSEVNAEASKNTSVTAKDTAVASASAAATQAGLADTARIAAEAARDAAINYAGYTRTEADSRFINTAGDTLTGPLTLASDPSSSLHAASKQYVDNNSGEQIGSIKGWLTTAAPTGWLALDTGALVSRAVYPQLWAWVQDHAPLITEAAWQAQAAAQSSVGAYSSGDGSTTFRLPRILDYPRGGLMAEVGTWQGDAIRNITGNAGTVLTGYNLPNGAFAYTGRGNLATGGSSYSAGDLYLDISRQVPVATENRPKTIKFIYCVKAFAAPDNPGMIDITALAGEVANKSGTRCWVSSEFAPTAVGVPVSVSHGISGLDLTKAKAEVLAICKVANNGFSVGDIVANFNTGFNAQWAQSPQITLGASTVETITYYANSIYLRNKTNGTAFSQDFSTGSWKLFFRIWY